MKAAETHGLSLMGGFAVQPEHNAPDGIASIAMLGLSRDGWTRFAASPEAGERLFNYLVGCARQRHSPVDAGRFGAHMQVHLVNDGPVTLWLETATD